MGHLRVLQFDVKVQNVERQNVEKIIKTVERQNVEKITKTVEFSPTGIGAPPPQG
jgi:hypothetical protein